MYIDEFLIPQINDGRFFVSPILGCTGACSYCYLKIKDYSKPRINTLANKNLLEIAQQSPDFSFGAKGTIISVGAWGDIFPLNNKKLIQHSIDTIKFLLSWGNPVQIMSKNTLNQTYIHEISQGIQYPGQLLYSTTITTVEWWRRIEPGTASPQERLNTTSLFHQVGIPTNVLLKPFIPKLTGKEISQIADLLLFYEIDYCTIGVMYMNSEILDRIRNNSLLAEKLDLHSFLTTNHLDCNGESPIISTSIDDLLPYIDYLRKRGITTFLKSTCVNSNILHISNISNYMATNNPYCINCGNCCKAPHN